MISKIKTNINLILKKGVREITIIISVVIFIIYSLFQDDISDENTYLIFAGVILIGFLFYYWWKRENAIMHNEKVNAVINKKLHRILDEKEADNKLLTEAHDYLASIVHKDNKKLDAMQRSIEKLIMRSQQTIY